MSSQTVKEATGTGVDVVVETVGEATWARSLGAVAPGGRVAVCGATSGPNPPAALHRFWWKQLTVYGSSMGSRDDFLGAYDLVRSGRARVHVDTRVPARRDAGRARAARGGRAARQDRPLDSLLVECRSVRIALGVEDVICDDTPTKAATRQRQSPRRWPKPRMNLGVVRHPVALERSRSTARERKRHQTAACVTVSVRDSSVVPDATSDRASRRSHQPPPPPFEVRNGAGACPGLRRAHVRTRVLCPCGQRQPSAGATSVRMLSMTCALYSTPSWFGTVSRSVSAAAIASSWASCEMSSSGSAA